MTQDICDVSSKPGFEPHDSMNAMKKHTDIRTHTHSSVFHKVLAQASGTQVLEIQVVRFSAETKTKPDIWHPVHKNCREL